MMGCGGSQPYQEENMTKSEKALKAALLIQNWYRQYKARLEARRRYTWNIFQSIEYAGEQDQLQLYNFFNDMINAATDDEISKVRFKQSLDYEDTGYENEVMKEDKQLKKMTNYAKIKIEKTYQGPHITFPLTIETVKQLIEDFKEDKRLHAKYTLQILHEVRNKLKSLPTVNQATAKIAKQLTVCGDLHGKLDDLLVIFHKNGLPSQENPYIFNGDFVDRGQYSVEVALILFSLLLIYPNEVYINRGNHEDHIMNLRYGFIKEVMSKYKRNSSKVVKLFEDVFSWLPLATVIDGKIMVAHGGISDKTDLSYLTTIDRHKYLSTLKPPISESNEEKDHRETENGDIPDIDYQEWRQVLDVLWSDPKNQEGCRPNTFRGGGTYFGPDISKKVLAKHGLDLLIRSHECKEEGYEYTHNGLVLTVFSASNYYEEGSNKGAYIKLDADLNLRMVQYMASKTQRLSVSKSIGIVENSAVRDLKAKIAANKTQLLEEFKYYDKNNSGYVAVSEWAAGMEKVLKLDLPWRTLRPKLVPLNENGQVEYSLCLDMEIIHGFKEAGPSVTETLYRNRDSLETIFRIMDKDNSGQISMEEFQESMKLLSKHIHMEMSDSQISDLAKSIDMNKDGYIDFNEFLEAFRLVNQNIKDKEDDGSTVVENGKT